MSRKKGIAVLLPALALVAATTEVHAGTMALSTLTSAVSAPQEAPDEPQGPGDQRQAGHRHGGGGQAPTDPPTEQPTEQPSEQPTDPQPTEQPTDQPTEQPTDVPDPGETADPGDQGDEGEEGGQQEQGPKAEDFIDIRQVQPNQQRVRQSRGGSRGSFTSRCGRNENQHHNPDNFIVAPGVSNGAHHIHDYVGNLSTDGFSTDDSLAAAGTTCRSGDKSTYFWPVMRIRAEQDNSDQAQQSTQDGNVGKVVTPSSVSLRFQGNPRSKVTAMPRFLRIIMGDAKAATNGPANARAKWTCSGFTNRTTTKYPLCPGGSRVTRVLDFPSCWDGRNVDSANHRTHVLFADQAGNCPSGTRAIPQLRMTLSFNLPGQPLAFAVDSFPEQLHNPITDHADFENVMPGRLMRQAVDCINRGRNC